METPFDRFWSAYPRRAGSSGKAMARLKFERATRKVDPELVIAAAARYAAENEKKIGTEFIAMAETWLNKRRWEDYAPEERKAPLPEDELQRLREAYRRKQEAQW